MRLDPSSPGLWVVLLAVGAAAGRAAELSLRPLPGILITPLAVAAFTLFLAFLLHLRNRANQMAHQRQMARASELQLATIEALALAIDARAQVSESQLRREQKLAGALAEALGLPPDQVEGVRTAALLHDVGHLAVPDQILTKRAPLTREELAKLRVHVEIGAEIIANVPFPYPVASLVRSHHERWDGTGYPAGLRGTAIPLGARILAVVDYFAELTSNRPHHAAMPTDEAVHVVHAESGQALDPVVVARFIELLPTLDDRPDAAPQAPALGAAAAAVAGDQTSDATRDQDAALAHIAVARKELHGLYEIAEAVGSSLGVTDSMNAIASTLRPLVPFSTCALFLRDAANGIVRCRFASGIGDAAFQGLLFSDGAGIVGRAIAARACVTGGPPPPGTTDPGMPVGELHSALATPLIVDDVAVGTLVLYQATPDYFNDDHRRLATRVSDQIAAVIGNSLVFERTQEESVTDALTGLPNTRFLFPHLTREIARASRLNSPMAVLLVDLDRLKHINDNFSHPIGDRALRAVAAVLRGAIRPYDLCVRYGGDEFIVLLSDCGPEQAEAKRVELKRAVEALPFSAGEGLPVKLSISAGAAVFPGDGETYDALLQEADSRMYKDKAAGHGRGGA